MSDNWFYAKNGKRSGPVSTAELQHILLHHPKRYDLLVWRSDFADWQKASDVPALAEPPPLPVHDELKRRRSFLDYAVLISAFVPLGIVVVLFVIWPDQPSKPHKKIVQCESLKKEDAISATRDIVRLRIKSSATAQFLSDGEGVWFHGCSARVVGKFDSVPRAKEWSTYYGDVLYLPDQDLWVEQYIKIDERP